MTYVLLTAIGIGGATVMGSVIGFFLRRTDGSSCELILAYASGIMMAASVFTLVIPSVEGALGLFGDVGVSVTVAGLFAGALTLTLLDRLMADKGETVTEDARDTHPLLFVLAIAIHNLPEGLAAGVSFGSGDVKDTILISGSIALQNIPEGVVLIPPLIKEGFSPMRAFLIAASTGVIEVVGTLIGYFAVSISYAVLPFALSFAGGTMLYVIADDMIPRTHSGSPRASTYLFLFGFATMVVFDALI